MTTPARQDEADQVELLYYWAINQLANRTIIDSRILWKEVPASKQAAESASWLSHVIDLVMGHRALARELAISYYRLVRALRTGHTITDPFREEKVGGTVSLEALRDQFVEIVDDVDRMTGSDVPPTATQSQSEAGTPDGGREVPPSTPEPSYEDEEFDEDDAILLEELANLDELIAQQDEDAEQEAALVLDQLGIENLLSQLEDIDESQPGTDVDADRASAHEHAGNRQAAAAARIMMNAARGLVYDLASTDLRIIGWVRYSTSGTPCGFCSMLMSRTVFYRTRARAQHQGQGQTEDKYHDNCRCVTVPIFLQDQFDNSPLFDLNKQFAAEWKTVTKGKGGDAAMSLWRKHMRQRNARIAAQEAA